MKFVCQHCQTRYSIADEKVRQRILRIRCKTCNEVITVRGEEGEAASPSASQAQAPRVSGAEWYVSIDGSRQGPMVATEAARVLLASGRSQGTYVWKDGFGAWKPAADVPEIANEMNAQRAKGRAPAVPPPPPPPLPRPSSSHPAEKHTPAPVKPLLPSASVAAPATKLPLPTRATTRPPLPSARATSSSLKAPPLPSLKAETAAATKSPSGPSAGLSRPAGSGAPPLPRLSATVPVATAAAKASPVVGSSAATPPSGAPGLAPAAPAAAPATSTLPSPAGAAHAPAPLARPSVKSMPVAPAPEAKPASTVAPASEAKPASASSDEFDEAPPTQQAALPAQVTGAAAAVAAATKAKPASASSDEFDEAPPTQQATLPAQVTRAAAAVSTAPASTPTSAPDDADPFAFLDEDNEQTGQKAAAPAPVVVAPVAVAPVKEVTPAPAPEGVATPAPRVAAAGADAVAAAPTSLFGSVLASPVPASRAESGLSRLTGLPGLVHRYQGLKYIVAGGVIVVLVLVIVVLTWSRDGNKSGAWAQKEKPNKPSVAAVDETRTREEAERMFRATVPTKESVAQVPPRRSGSRPSPKPPAAPIEPGKLVQNDTPKTAEQEAASRRFENSTTSPTVPRVSASPTHAVREVSQSQISAVVRDKNNQAGLKLCYERALKLGGQVRSGRVDVTVSIGASGIVKNVQVQAPVELSAVESCIKSAVRRWAFPNNVEEYGTTFPVILQGS